MKRKARAPVLLGGEAIALCLVWAFGCSPQSESAPSDSGVPEWVVASEPLVSIGAVDGSPDYLFDRVAGVRLVGDSRVAVADGGSRTIRVYGLDGRLERQWGGDGEGPGEFVFISGLWLREPDTLVVYDSGKARLTAFRTQGEMLPRITTFRADDGSVEVYLGRFADGAHALAWIRRQQRDETTITPDHMRFGRFGPDGNFEELLGEDLGMRRLGSPIPFSAHFLGVVLRDAVYHTDGMDSEIRVTSESGERLGAIQADVDRWGFKEASSRFEASLDSAGVRRFRELRGTPGLDSVPSISELLLDSEQLLWLKRYEPAVDSHWQLRQRTGGEWLVIEPDGNAAARVSVPTGFRLMDVRGEYVAGMSRDGLGVERVEVRRLTRRSRVHPFASSR